jgi:hypothetical protein
VKLDKISDLIAHLTKIRSRHGDLDILVENHPDTDFRPIVSVKRRLADGALEQFCGMKEGTPYFLIIASGGSDD